MLVLGEGGSVALPHPRENWNDFLRGLSKLVEKQKMQWNPVKKRQMPWISLRKLESMYGRGESSHSHRHDGHDVHPEQNRPSLQSSHEPPGQRRYSYTLTQNPSVTATGKDLMSVPQRWSHQPPSYTTMYSMERILVTAPRTFPPQNTKVEPQQYFSKWKTFDKEAFADESGDELGELLERGMILLCQYVFPLNGSILIILCDMQHLQYKTHTLHPV